MASLNSPAKIKNENDQHKLSEFAPLSSDTKPVGGFFSRLLNRNKSVNAIENGSKVDDQNVASLPCSQTSSPVLPRHVEPEPERVASNEIESNLSNSSDGIIPQTRNLSSVLTRLRSILDNRKGQDLQAYKDSDFKQYWMPDDNCKECYECSDKFTTFRRRHHCRICGQIFCSRCCNQEVPGHIFGYTGDLRVCTYCGKVVLSYAHQTDASGDLRALRENLTSNLNSDVPMYQEFGRWTPLARKRPSDDDFLHSSRHQRSGSLPDNTSFTKLRATMTPQFEFTSMESIKYERKMLIQDSVQLKGIWLQLQNPVEGLVMQTHRFRLRTYTNCLFGKELVDWLIDRDKVTTRVQAMAIGQALMDAKLLESISSRNHVFENEYSLYRLGEACLESPGEVASLNDATIMEDESEPVWIKDIITDGESDDSMFDDDIEGKENGDNTFLAQDDVRSTSYFNQTNHSISTKPKKYRHASSSSDKGGPGDREVTIGDEFVSDALLHISNRKDTVSRETIPNWWKAVHSEHHHEDSVDSLAYERLGKAQFDHMSMLVKQLLGAQGLALSWTEMILQIAQRICEFVSPDVKIDEDDMDIRQYVQIKKVAGGQRMHSNIVFGVVCTKTVAHKKMTQNIASPRILLLQSSIEYQRVEGKFSSLDPQILQEHEYLKNCVAKIASLKPDILLVEKTVSRLAQEFILHAGITLVLNVKPTVMERVARFTQADIVPSIDGLVSKPRLGLCHKFYSQHYRLPNGSSKTLMFFDGCANHLGCTVTLRGGSQVELQKVKKILHFMVYVAYHSKLETSFIMDEHGMPPPDPTEMVLNIDVLENSSEESTVSPSVTGDREPVRMKEGSFISKLIKNPNTMENLREKNIESKNVDDMIYESEATNQSEHLSALYEEAENSTDAMESTDVFQEEFNFDDAETLEVNDEDEGIREMTDVINSLPVLSNDIITEKENEKNIVSTTSVHSSETELVPIPYKDFNAEGSCFIQAPGLLIPPAGLDDQTLSQPSTPEIRRRLRRINSSEVTDFSDPLHNYQKSKDETIFQSKSGLKVMEEVAKNSYKFKKTLCDVILSISPYVKYDIPYLETESGAKCDLRKYFCRSLYWSDRFKRQSSDVIRQKSSYEVEVNDKNPTSPNVEMKEMHPFVSKMMTAPITDSGNQALLADFRARGGKIHPLSQEQIQTKLKRNTIQDNSVKIDCEKSKTSSTRNIDCLDVYNHQRLVVLFSSYSYVSINSPNPCINPWVLTMDFYGRIDFTLGNFLERFCFRESYNCPSEVCDTPMVDHIRRFAHDNGCIQIILRKVESSALGYPNHIVMWNWCRKCKKITPPVPMSGDTWAMSFAKYLELRFHGSAYTRRSHDVVCTHSLHHDHYQYFGFKQIVAAFKYTTITLREVSLPSFVLNINEVTKASHTSSAIDETKSLAVRGHGVYSTIMEHLYKLKAEIQTDLEDRSLAIFLTKLKDERIQFREHIEKLQLMLTSPSLRVDETILQNKDDGEMHKGDEEQGVQELLFKIKDSIVQLKKMIAEAVENWNYKISDFLENQKKIMKNKAKQYKESSTPDSLPEHTPLHYEDAMGMDVDEVDNSDDGSILHAENSVKKEHQAEHKALLHTMETLSEYEKTQVERDLDDAMREVQTSHDSESSGMSSYSKENYVYGVTPGISSSGLFPNSLPKKDLVTLDNDSYIVCSRRGTEPDLSNAANNKSDDDFVLAKQAQGEVSEADIKRGQKCHPSAQLSQVSDDPDSFLHKVDKRTTVKQLFSNLLAGSTLKLLPPQFPAEEHHLLPSTAVIPVVVYDNEPSSIIAYTLSSHEYDTSLQELKMILYNSYKSADSQTSSPAPSRRSLDSESTEQSSQSRKTNAVLSFFRGNNIKEREKSPARAAGKPAFAETVDSVKYSRNLDRDSVELDDTIDEPDFGFYSVSEIDRNKGPSAHVEVQFSDNTAKFFCKVYYAEQFRQLRKLIFPYGEERYIRSLSRCVPWMARGGKSGSSFCKTKDNRFVLKQMSEREMQSFLHFAPHYFQYITKAFGDQQPTVLAKILGVYRVCFRNTQTTTASKQDVLVIENLFYGRKVSQTFDLKGSMRNRLVNTAGKQEEELVLLDENLLKLIVDNPLYIRPHSKTVLTLAITSDTHFLSSHLVMDYSLLVGIDEAKKELVVGIIDYIRTFTWDKKLEMVVKSTGILGGQGKMPTVVSPDMYRNRFLEAMERYFLLVPDRWSGLGCNVDT